MGEAIRVAFGRPTDYTAAPFGVGGSDAGYGAPQPWA